MNKVTRRTLGSVVALLVLFGVYEGNAHNPLAGQTTHTICVASSIQC